MKKKSAILSVILVVLIFFASVGCMKKEEKPVQRIALSASEGAPDSIIKSFIVSVIRQSFGDYTYESHTVRHDVYSEIHNNMICIVDYADMDVKCRKNDGLYRFQLNAVLIKNPETEEWGFTSMSHTVPELIESGAALPGEDSVITYVTEPPVLPTETPVPKTTDTPSPKPTDTQAPSPTPESFLFGGATIYSGSTEIKGTVEGINGDKNGRFTHITEKEAEMLAALCPDLRVLDLDYCWFDTYEPLAKLKNLEYLELKSCGTDLGGRKLTDIDWIKNLTKLNHLNLCHNGIEDISALRNLSGLEWLNLGDNQLNNDALKDLSDLSSLYTLFLYTNKITDVTALSSLHSVIILNVGNNKKLKTVKPLVKMKNLKDLRIFNTAVSDLSYFPGFKKLERVDLAGCPLKFKEYYDNLPNCPKLKTFVVSIKDTEGISAGDKIINDGYSLNYEIK